MQIGHEGSAGLMSVPHYTIPPLVGGLSAGGTQYPATVFHQLLSSFQGVLASNDASSETRIVALKEENERLREQMQNLRDAAAVDDHEARKAWQWACPILKQARPDLASKLTPTKWPPSIPQPHTVQPK